MSRYTRYGAMLGSLVFLSGIGAVAAADNSPSPRLIRTAEPEPLGTLRPARPAEVLPAKTLADINQRLNAMQRQINRLQSELAGLRRMAAAKASSASGSTAAEAKTLAAEARSIAQRAEQKAEQALSTATQALSVAQSN